MKSRAAQQLGRGEERGREETRRKGTRDEKMSEEEGRGERRRREKERSKC